MILISPAKRLVDRENSSNLKSSEPIFQSEANKLAEHMATLSSKELQSLMGVSEDIAKLNQHRYNNWNNANNLENRAIFQFEGDVYKNLDASSLSKEEQDYLNKNLRILSGIYGLLKPSDSMNPYRLEMGTKHDFLGSKNLYEFWGSKIADAINKELGDNYLFNLASEEYYAAVKKHLNSNRVVNFRFASLKDGKLKVIGIIAKRARGEMARFLIKNKVSSLDPIKKFSALGFGFQEFKDNEFVFVQK